MTPKQLGQAIGRKLGHDTAGETARWIAAVLGVTERTATRLLDAETLDTAQAVNVVTLVEAAHRLGIGVEVTDLVAPQTEFLDAAKG